MLLYKEINGNIADSYKDIAQLMLLVNKALLLLYLHLGGILIIITLFFYKYKADCIIEVEEISYIYN